jgi:preprotein translocase subunit SecD
VAKKRARPGRTLILFFVGLSLMYGLVALAGSWTPELGLDLRGGTRITLNAKGDPSQQSLDEARSIIDQRVNGSGVAEAEVTTQGGDVIAVEIPGERRRDLIETVQRQAQLRFRLVACSDSSPCTSPQQAPTDPTDPNAAPTGPAVPETTAPEQPVVPEPEGSDGTANPRPPTGYAADGTDTPSADPSPTDDPSASPSEGASETTSGEDPSATPTPADVADESAVADLQTEYQWSQAPDAASVELFNKYACDADGNLTLADGSPVGAENAVVDDPLKPLVACSPPEGDPDSQDYRPAEKFLLSQSIISGTDLEGADFGIPQNEVQYVVTLDIGGKGQDVFTQASETLTTDVDRFAIVLDGQVLSAPTFQGRIPDGNAQISGNFTEASASSLATSLRYGALPISFEEPSVETIGPSLAGDQLRAGLTAGAFGLGLVLIYCLFYYRGLGLVVVSSLLAAAATTYALVLLLSGTAGFTLTLPGIAGLIIAVGVTADSFIIFLERIRDEMREGKSMRVAVETGWKRAKVTRLAAQVVSLLSAVVLYVFATGAVKGFGFALGLTTLVDLAILFWFTKPMVSWLAKFRFFNSGSRFSGLSKETLGIDDEPRTKRVPAAAGGKA